MAQNDTDRTAARPDDERARDLRDDAAGDSRGTPALTPGLTRNEHEGDGEREGIPANGTRAVKPQGPEDFGGNAWGEGN